MNDKINDEQRRNDAQQPPPAAPQNTPAPTTDHDRRTNSQIADLEKRISSYERGMLRWTRIVAAFTVVSAAIAGLYAYSFIQSERAFLTVPDVAFANSEPSSGPNGIATIVTIENVGKHTASGINLKINSAF